LRGPGRQAGIKNDDEFEHRRCGTEFKAGGLKRGGLFSQLRSEPSGDQRNG
jgi:hypothetical protein